VLRIAVALLGRLPVQTRSLRLVLQHAVALPRSLTELTCAHYYDSVSVSLVTGSHVRMSN
jgi:hypothetical protein